MTEKTLPHAPPILVSDVSSDPDTQSLTSDDRLVMQQMGKRQQLKRRFTGLSIFGLSITLLSSYEALGMSLAVAMTAGGPVSLVYGMLFVFAGTMALAASIAEMASICPISGAQMHWTYMFAPKEWRVGVTFIQGWVTVFAWQTVGTSLAYLMAGQLLGLVKLNNPQYVIQRWHTTLMMWAIVLLAYVQHMWAIKLLPMIEVFTGALHILMFFAIFVVMLVLGRNASAGFVFTGFVNETGWESDGVAWFIGLLPSIWALAGFDGAIHLSEETERSAHVIPKVIMWTILVNAPTAWIFALLCLFSISDASAVINTPTGFPLIEILHQATRSRAGATAIYAFIMTINFGAMFADIASVSRLTWAFARDDGLPFSNYFKRIETNQRIPVRAVNLLCGVIVLLSLINIGSSVAFNAFISLTTIAMYTSYIIPICCLISMRLRVRDQVYDSAAGHAEISEERLVFGPWNLGKWGMLVNVCAVLYAALMLPFMALPTSSPVTPARMNFAGPIFLSVLCFASVDYWLRGRKVFVGPRQET